jgi:hypothetical protein
MSGELKVMGWSINHKKGMRVDERIEDIFCLSRHFIK